jgi:hypothetical protein
MARPHRPKGAWSDKAWRDAIRVAVNRVDSKKGKRLAQLADALVSAGLAGDVPAMKEIGDRLDGKVPQALVGGGPDAAPIAVQLIELRPVEPK